MKFYPFALTTIGIGTIMLLTNIKYVTKYDKSELTKQYLDQLDKLNTLDESSTALSSNQILLDCVTNKVCAVEPGYYFIDEANNENERVANLLRKAIIEQKANPYELDIEYSLNTLDYAIENELCGKLQMKRDVAEYQATSDVEEMNKLKSFNISALIHAKKHLYDCVRFLGDLIDETHYNATHHDYL